MSKNLTVNCGNAALLSDNENFLDQYDTLLFNCGNLHVSEGIYARLAAKNITYNCGNTNIVKQPENPVRQQGLLTVSGGGRWQGLYPVCDSALITVEGMKELAEMEGLLALGKLYYPKDAGQLPAQFHAEKFVPYPTDACPLIGNACLRPGEGNVWLPDTLYFVSGTLYALDNAMLAKLKAQGISFYCESVYLYEGMLDEYGAMFVGSDIKLIPDGYALASESMPLADLYASHGKKIYLLAGLTVQPGDVRHLARFESILVKKTAHLPLEYLDECEKVIQADKVSVFEGELLDINGFQMVGREMLAAANARGVKYTVRVNGFLLVNEDVTDDDMQAIVSAKINGAVSAPAAAQAQLTRVAGKVNGAMLPSLSEIKKMMETAPGEALNGLGGIIPKPMAKMLGIKTGEDDASLINCGNYVLI